MNKEYFSVGNTKLSKFENTLNNCVGSLGHESQPLLNSADFFKYENNPFFLIPANIDTLHKPDLKLIIGDDDREESSISQFPYNCIAQLLIHNKYGQVYSGTGFFISKRCVITAGHCVYEDDSWVKEIEVIPGAKGSTQPYGSEKSSIFRSVKGWTKSGNQNYDYGAVILESDDLFNNIKSFFGFKEPDNQDRLIELSGYPQDKSGTQWKCYGTVDRFTEYQIFYELDTVIGNSGSPVFIKEGRFCIVVGVHIFGDSIDNSSIRINSGVLNRWHEWSNL